MADRLLIEASVTTTHHEIGYREWVVEDDRVRGLLAGGYFHVVERAAGRGAKSAPVSHNVPADGIDDLDQA